MKMFILSAAAVMSFSAMANIECFGVIYESANDSRPTTIQLEMQDKIQGAPLFFEKNVEGSRFTASISDDGDVYATISLPKNQTISMRGALNSDGFFELGSVVGSFMPTKVQSLYCQKK